MAKRRQDEQMMNSMENLNAHGMRTDESTGSQNSSNMHSISHFSRRDLKGVVESSHLDSSKNETGTANSQYSLGNTKLTSNVDSIYGFYKKKGIDGDDLEEDDPHTIQENSRNTSNFENTANMGNYVPANQMLDLRLLNAEINASINSNHHKQDQRQDARMAGLMGSGKSSRAKGTGEKGTPIEIFSFKQSANKRNYNTLNQKTLWNADPLNRKYGLEMSSIDNEQSAVYNHGRRGVGAHNLVVKDQDSNEENQRVSDDREEKVVNPSFGMIFSNRPTQGVAGIGKMSEYAQTGIYIDPNQITRKIKPKKKQSGRDIKYAIKDLEAASFMDMDDFMTGGLVQAKKPVPNEEPVDDHVTEQEIQNTMSMEKQYQMALKRPKRDQNYGIDNFKQNLMNRVNLSNLENQDFQKMVNIFYKDMKYPVYDFNHVCPPPPTIRNSTRNKHHKLEVPLCQSYREHLFGLKKSEEETKSLVESDQITENRPLQFRVVAIERRYGMASLIVQNELKNPTTLTNTYSKVLLSPIFDNLKIWNGDKIQLAPDYQVFKTNIRQFQGMDMDIQFEDLDEPHINQIIVSKSIVNMTTATDMDTNTETASMSLANDASIAVETMSHRQDESMSNRCEIENSSNIGDNIGENMGDINDLETNSVA